jgi:hypothetical protein
MKKRMKMGARENYLQFGALFPSDEPTVEKKGALLQHKRKKKKGEIFFY